MQTQSPTQTKSCTVPTVLSRGAQNEWTWQMRTAVLLLSKAPILGSTHQMLSLVILPTKPFSLGDAIQYTCKVPSFVSRFYIMILYYELGIDILLCSGKCVTCLFYSWEDSRGTFACSRTWGGQEPQVFTQHKTFIQILPGLHSPFMNLGSQGNPLLLPLHHPTNKPHRFYSLHAGQKHTHAIVSD